jgi:zinc transport system substrate-binding protein
MRRLKILATALLVSASGVRADVPNVVVDIPPVFSLVSSVMQGVGTPKLLLRGNESPHNFALRPSQRRDLGQADIIFWIGEGLTPWLEKAQASLTQTPISVALGEQTGVVQLSFREGAFFENHDDHDGRGEVNGHTEHNHEETHENAAAHDGKDHQDHAGHDHAGLDPHFWLDPENAIHWIYTIADILSQTDPENAGAYYANAAKTKASLELLNKNIAQQLAPHRAERFLIVHDAFQYFEARFGLAAQGAISDGHAAPPSAARILAIRKLMQDQKISCVFAEPGYNAKLLDNLISGTSVRLKQLDPLGAGLPMDHTLYEAVLKNMADTMVACFTNNEG